MSKMRMEDVEEFIVEPNTEKEGGGSKHKEEYKKKPAIKTPLDMQRWKLEKLMKNPDKPIIIPQQHKEKDFMQSVPTFVRNVMGSSAGAGSGEFHVYRHLRRKEYARQKFIQAKSIREQLNEDYQNKIEKNRLQAESKTAKKRAKRLKRKQKMKQLGKKPKIDNSKQESEPDNNSESDDGSENEKDKDSETEDGNADKQDEKDCEMNTVEEQQSSNLKQATDLVEDINSDINNTEIQYNKQDAETDNIPEKETKLNNKDENSDLNELSPSTTESNSEETKCTEIEATQDQDTINQEKEQDS